MDAGSAMRHYFVSPPRPAVAEILPQPIKKKKKLTRQNLMDIIQRHGISMEEQENVSQVAAASPPGPPPQPVFPDSPSSELLSYEQEMELSNALASITPAPPPPTPPPPPVEAASPPPPLMPTCGPQFSWCASLFMCHACYFENTNNAMASPGGRVFITLSLCPRCAHVNCSVNSVIRKNEL